MHIWAEVGSCEGDLDYAIRAADAVYRAGAHALKVQWLTPDKIFSKDAVRYDHTPGDWIQQADGYPRTLTHTAWAEVADHCNQIGLGFIPSVFDTGAILEASLMGLAMMKIASGDITNEQLVKAAGFSDVPNLTLSTGGATMDEVEQAVRWVQESDPGKSITLLACHLEYPTPVPDAHLGRILALREKFPNLNVGYSDHTHGLDTTPLVVSLGAQVLEKHFTLDRDIGTGDHAFAVDETQLSEMVQLSQLTLSVIDNIELVPSSGEQAALTGARRSLYAARSIERGTKLTEDDLIPLRPHNSEGIDASSFWDTVGFHAFTDIAKGDLIGEKAVGGSGATLTVE
jgi:sialic acid synthase SpsE